MTSQLTKWICSLWGRMTAFAVGLAALLAVGDFFWKWGLYSLALSNAKSYILPALNRNFDIPVYILLLSLILLVSFLFVFIKGIFKKKEYFIQIRARHSNGFELSEFARRTKWNFKGYKSFYFIPLLSHGYNSIEFVDMCGPFCTNCNHLLHLEGSGRDLGHTFSCINCNNKYKIPKELLGDYWNRLYSFFQEEFRQGRLRETQ